MMYLLTCGAAALAIATPALAATDTISLFSTAAVSDGDLGKATGTGSPYAALTSSTLLKLSEEQSRADFRGTGSVTNVQMDVWWGTVGSELIANAVRSTV